MCCRHIHERLLMGLGDSADVDEFPSRTRLVSCFHSSTSCSCSSVTWLETLHLRSRLCLHRLHVSCLCSRLNLMVTHCGSVPVWNLIKPVPARHGQVEFGWPFSELQSMICVSQAKVGLSWLQHPWGPRRRPWCSPEGTSHWGCEQGKKTPYWHCLWPF